MIVIAQDDEILGRVNPNMRADLRAENEVREILTLYRDAYNGNR